MLFSDWEARGAEAAEGLRREGERAEANRAGRRGVGREGRLRRVGGLGGWSEGGLARRCPRAARALTRRTSEGGRGSSAGLPARARARASPGQGQPLSRPTSTSKK